MSPTDKALRDEFEKIKEARRKANETQSKAAKSFLAGGLYQEKEAAITRVENELPQFDLANPQVYFDIEIGETEKGRVVFELFKSKVPKTVENFRAICTGNNDKHLTYVNNNFHRVIAGFMMQGGDITMGNGTGGMSIYGARFPDEKLWLPHTHPGLLSMANSGPDTNGSQFFITFDSFPHLDGKHTVFGKVTSGVEVVQAMAAVGSQSGATKKQVVITDCGQL